MEPTLIIAIVAAVILLVVLSFVLTRIIQQSRKSWFFRLHGVEYDQIPQYPIDLFFDCYAQLVSPGCFPSVTKPKSFRFIFSSIHAQRYRSFPLNGNHADFN